jgi:dTDP-4-dehydrorhamnose 3,5-epimerase
MKITPTDIPDVLIIEPTVFGDSRGFFFESYNQKKFMETTGLQVAFVQDNHSRSQTKHVLRGLHYQIQQPQGKLVRVISGEVFDVAVDIRRSSPTFGKWVGDNLTAENKKQMWVPPDSPTGFSCLSDVAEFLYKTTDYWAPEHERCIRWNDPVLNVQWPITGNPLVSEKDEQRGFFPGCRGVFMKALIIGGKGQLGTTLTQTVPKPLNAGHSTCRKSTSRMRKPSRPSSRRKTRCDHQRLGLHGRGSGRRRGRPCLCRQRDRARKHCHGGKENRRRLIHVSTDYVFDGTACTPLPAGSPLQPLGVYGKSKRQGEINVLDADR